MVDPVDAAYAAGFFDADGCVATILPSKGTPRISLKVTQKTPGPCLAMKEILGVGEVYKHTSGWEWAVQAKAEVCLALEIMRPYLQLKHAEATMAHDCLYQGGPLKRAHIEAIRSCRKGRR